jgi:hypothetical protein
MIDLVEIIEESFCLDGEISQNSYNALTVETFMRILNDRGTNDYILNKKIGRKVYAHTLEFGGLKFATLTSFPITDL